MITKIISGILVLVILFMGVKQGLAMVQGKPEMINMFRAFGFDKIGVMVMGIVLLVSVVLISWSQTFVYGNFLMAATILFILCFQLHLGNIKGAAMEIPFLLLNMVAIYLKHPLK
ncbi:hypothetical protein [Maribacter hydrothermalis]|uniref:DoxX-like family protein n=1 Tax=Maribacter hydrothermalis TaxID=1836467 RepID=A0A1B7Z7M8_9FLAO|nr:hypothetical protein [Maribacter hydrothermalis]APQ15935.1 hypothetical protein BTR34_00625 [Maribacter hydrothermalis]OBR38686.1 hypothetical protein A9200_03185 [Maribacter hydrothermalis]